MNICNHGFGTKHPVFLSPVSVIKFGGYYTPLIAQCNILFWENESGLILGISLLRQPCPVHFGVDAVDGLQVVVPPALDDAALFEDQNLVGILNR